MLSEQMLGKYMEIVSKHAVSPFDYLTIPVFTIAYSQAREQGKKPEEAVKFAVQETGIDEDRAWEIAEDLELLHEGIVQQQKEGGS